MKVGLWDSRVSIEQNAADPSDKARGVWNAHVKAWNNALDRKCSSLLVFESDVFFDKAAFEQARRRPSPAPPRVRPLRSSAPHPPIPPMPPSTSPPPHAPGITASRAHASRAPP